MFVGRHDRQVDQKGRLAMPSPYRPKFETGCYLAPGQDGCIDVFTPEEFERMANEALEKVRRGEMSRAEQRVLASNTFLQPFDAQGRITLDPVLRAHAGVDPGSAVVVTGSFDRVEIWRPDAYGRVQDTGAASLRGGA